MADRRTRARDDARRRTLLIVLSVAIVAVAATVVFSELGTSSLLGDEAIYANIGLRLAQESTWLPLRYPDGDLYFWKPPLRIWIHSLVFRWLGTDDVLVRAPDAIFGIATVLLAFLFGVWAFDTFTGLAAAMLLLGANGWIFDHGVRSGTTDSLANLLVTAALFGWIRSLEEDGRRKWVLLAGVATCVGLAELTRCYFGLAIASFLTLSAASIPRPPQTVFARVRHALPILAVAVAVSSTWNLYCVSVDQDSFLRVQRLNLVVRATEGVDPTHLNDTYFYCHRLASDFGPWLLLLFALPFVFPIGRMSCRRTATVNYLFVWCIVVVGILSVSASKLPWYVFPAYPSLAVLLASGLRVRHRAPKALSLIVTTVLALSLTAELVQTWRTTRQPPLKLDLDELTSRCEGTEDCTILADARLLRRLPQWSLWYLLRSPRSWWIGSDTSLSDTGDSAMVLVTELPGDFPGACEPPWQPVLPPSPLDPERRAAWAIGNGPPALLGVEQPPAELVWCYGSDHPHPMTPTRSELEPGDPRHTSIFANGFENGDVATWPTVVGRAPASRARQRPRWPRVWPGRRPSP